MMSYWWAILLLLAVTVSCAQAGVLYKSNFEQDPLAEGWRAWVPDGQSTPPAWADTAAHSGKRCLQLTQGRWRSPLLPVTPGMYYCADAFIKAEGPGLWHTWFFTAAQGKLDPALPAETMAFGACAGTDAAVKWTKQSTCFSAPPGVAYVQLVFEPQNGKVVGIDDVTVRQVTPKEGVRWANAIYATVKPIAYTPPADRWQSLPKTRTILEKGGMLRMVLLGSSNMNDMAGSCPELLLRQKYPKVNCISIPSVRGSSGCKYFSAPEQVKSYILDQHPDVLVIECSSFGSDIASICSVIQQVRAACDADIVLATTAFYNPEWLKPIDPNGADFFAGVLRLSQEEHTGFIDFGRSFSRYIADCGKPVDYYLRDTHHLNDRGKQVLARIFAGYFAVK
ncbi:MAG: SGNH/GDSL hydrolase family protein [Armatimonadota bacterium]